MNQIQKNTFAIDLAERGLIPDALVRFGIRKLGRQRLKEMHGIDCEKAIRDSETLYAKSIRGPIAPVPEMANQQHYEVPTSFFVDTLGQRLKYSCCFFESDTGSLDQAEIAALKLTCDRAELVDGMKVLELGCGWGSLTLWIAEHFPNIAITAVSNSSSQREHILTQAKQRGIDGNLRVVTCDMNDFDTEREFDRVVSVEMFEHMRNYRELMRRISCWLMPTGKLFVHVFCHRSLAYEFHDRSSSDWMSRYFFTGGIMPSDDWLLRFQEDLRIENQWRWDGTHYEKTCNEWIRNMDQNRQAIMSTFEVVYGDDAERWFRRWRIFFMAGAEMFGLSNGQEWWVSHYLFQNAHVTALADRTSTATANETRELVNVSS